MKLKGQFDNVRIYDFAMNDNEMQQYASSSGQGLLVSGVEIDKDLVGGTITVENNRPAVGEEVILNVTPDANARVDKVFVDNEEIAPVGGVYKTTMKADGIFVSADFVRSFAVNIDSAITNGTLTADKTTAEEGETVTFTLTPESGYGVKEVKVNGAPIQAVNGVYSAVMLAADMNVTAEFAKQCSVTVKADIKGGTVTVNKSSVWSGDRITITPKPDEGYEIRKVTVNGVEIQKTGIIYKFTVTEDAVVDVRFGKIGGGGGCSGSLAIGGIATGLTALGAAAIVLLCKKRK
jgi:FKBP-type peptidyl-prolyl cis-trans isomerase 2